LIRFFLKSKVYKPMIISPATARYGILAIIFIPPPYLLQ
jgi:hypothetical protein